MLVVPLGIVGVLLAATLFNQKNDVYFMVGLLTTIGLSAKNASLSVEFAKDLMEKEGKGVVEATLMAVRMRLRPILMTSLAFILGVLPLAVSVMLVVPLGIVGVLLAATLFNQKNDVYFMVGLLTTIGLSAKNASLSVEFAKDLMEKEGKGVVEATLMAVRMRLRPILMTSLAFILGVLPLAIIF